MGISLRKEGLKSFAIALIVYLPIVLFLYQIQHDISKIEKKEHKELYPIAVFTKEEIQDLMRSAPHTPQKTAPQPAQKAGKTKTTKEVQKETKTDEPFDVSDLNDAFAPLQPNVTKTYENNETYIPNEDIASLYGAMILELTKEEKKYLESNLNNIGLITQRYLRYPSLAGQMGMHGETILYFTLMPNGDITPIELFKSSGFSLLDDNAIHTVEIAYKDYPHPKEPVRIRLRVVYRLY